ncbi:MAG: TadE/TadG family type IV pilus assembly protein [Anaerolineales bacterium]
MSKAIGSTLNFLAKAVKRNEGASAVEFALVLPILLTILTAIMAFGITFNNYEQLTDGVREAERVFAISRSSTTPYTLATTALQTGTPGLTFKNIKPTFTVNGAPCASDAGCVTALSGAQGQPSSLTATYACTLAIVGVSLPACNLSSSTTELVE